MEDLGEVLRGLSSALPTDAAGVLVGLDEADDAAVIDTGGPTALVLTVDFFTPIVDDARAWGRIAAANAMSDVYAMGGRPVAALNIAGWPAKTLPLDLLGEVLQGGLDAAREAGMVIVGGHTVDDQEPKYGMCVIGQVDRGAIMTLKGAQPGDVLVLTKPIGTGVISTSIKQDAAPADAVSAAIASMTHLNATASRAALDAGVRACTDVTGFGLLGHLQRMARASGLAAEIDASAVPLLPGARALAEQGRIPGGTEANMRALEASVTWDGTEEVIRVLLCDAQTSGGLLPACPPGAVDGLLTGLSGEPAHAVVGTLVRGEPGRIVVA